VNPAGAGATATKAIKSASNELQNVEIDRKGNRFTPLEDFAAK
jgi:hypothetical protein